MLHDKTCNERLGLGTSEIRLVTLNYVLNPFFLSLWPVDF